MNFTSTHSRLRAEHGSVLIVVLWVAIGLVSITLYFANSMTYELRASDNRVNGVVADQAIEGAQRYVSYVLENFATNGAIPDPAQFRTAAVEIGDAKFWLIGRDPANGNSTEPFFGLTDEGGKLSLNGASTNMLAWLPGMSYDFAEAITDWRSTNSTLALDYSTLGYSPKYAPFESVDELRLVSGATVSLLAGADLNRNGVLDKNEKDSSSSGEMSFGLFEYVTVWKREPNFHSDGTTLTNINTADVSGLTALLRNNNATSPGSRATLIYNYLRPRGGQPRTFTGLFDFAVFWREQGWSAEDFARINRDTTTSTNIYFYNRVNVNTATEPVLTALFVGLNVDESTAQSAAETLVTYRQQNPSSLASVAWVYDALGSSPVVTALRRGNYLTTHSYQFTADIAATGAFGRGWRRTRFLFDVSDGTPKVVYRQDLSRLGWALGDKTRATLLAQKAQKNF